MPHYYRMDENEDREGRVLRRIPPDTFAHRLLIARADSSLTIDDAAKRCGLGAQNWSNWEHGRVPRDKVEVAEAVAEGLNVDRDWLLHGGPLAVQTKTRRPRLPYPRRSLRPGDRHGERRARRLERIPA